MPSHQLFTLFRFSSKLCTLPLRNSSHLYDHSNLRNLSSLRDLSSLSNRVALHLYQFVFSKLVSILYLFAILCLFAIHLRCTINFPCNFSIEHHETLRLKNPNLKMRIQTFHILNHDNCTDFSIGYCSSMILRIRFN